MAPKKVKWNSMARRLTGVSIGLDGIGLSWVPPVNDRDVLRQLFIYLEDKRALYVGHDAEIRHFVDQSLRGIRQELTKSLQQVSEGSEAHESLELMRAACRATMYLIEPATGP